MPSSAMNPLSTQPGLRYARIAIARPVPQPLTYKIPASMQETLRIGSLVRVPLRGGRADGVVVDLVNKPDIKGPIKPIEQHLTPEYAIDQELIELGRWMADYYFASLGDCLATISMIGINDVSFKMRLHLKLAHPDHWLAGSREQGPDEQKTTAGHRAVINYLLAHGNPPTLPEILQEGAGVGPGVLKTMIDRGWLSRLDLAVERPDDYEHDWTPTFSYEITLTSHQTEVYAEIKEALESGEYKAFLLHGVTGSGKTEIYLRLIEDALRKGLGAIMLVPEIALTPQTVEALRRRLGGIVGIYHSRLSLGQKLDLWQRIVDREVRVVIGARSALFVPISDLGVIIVDEEHETSYKQGETPRYHGRDVAVLRALRRHAVAVLGSATPSIESLHNAREGKYRRLHLPQRVGPHASPIMTVVDMKRHIQAGELQENISSLLSPALKEAIDKRLAAREQIVLLLNRRGFANHVLCLRCETQIMCSRCDIPMTYHKTVDRLICHWCGEKKRVPRQCPNPQCRAEEIEVIGFGTQRIEELLQTLYPTARTLRVDMDSMQRKGSFQAAWARIRNHEVDIILGTQMIAKGLHLESVTLVGVISADFTLFLPDFRAAERTYALLTQVAGRAGRGAKPGEVIVQSFIPHHYAIDHAARLAETGFYERELHLRRMLRFPPFARLAALILSSPNEESVKSQAHQLSGILKALTYRPTYKSVRVLGPTPAPLARLEDQHRWRLLVRSAEVRDLHGLLKHGLSEFEKTRKKGQVNLVVDIDPTDLL